MTCNQSYDLFAEFINIYTPIGFNSINKNEPLMLKMEEMMEKNNQYFFIGDILQGKILFTSKRSIDLIGVESQSLIPTMPLKPAIQMRCIEIQTDGQN